MKTTTATNTFASLGLVKTLAAIEAKGYTEPTPVQAMTIPLFLEGKDDIVAQARTGTGKTAAFGLPLVELLEPRAGFVQAIVLTPTRELALQVCTEISDLAAKGGLTLLPVYGGQSMTDQLRKLRSGVDIVVGTPGRVMDHLRRGSLKLSQVTHFVLDEADEMLDMGFVDDIETILKSAPENRRMLLFSATMSSRIMKIAEKYMGSFKTVKIAASENAKPLTEQIVMEVDDRDRFEALCRVIDMEEDFYGIVFCRTRNDVDHVSQKLTSRGYASDALHGDVTQTQREKILSKMRSRDITILVATDVAARGIDIVGLSHVINYALPQDSEAYVHRVGRTGRAGKMGTAITFVARGEFRKIHFIRNDFGFKITEKELPSVDDIISIKKSRLADKVAASIAEGSHKDSMVIAKKLAEGNDPLEVIAALVDSYFGKELKASNYAEIKKMDPNARRSYSGSAPRRSSGGGDGYKRSGSSNGNRYERKDSRPRSGERSEHAGRPFRSSGAKPAPASKGNFSGKRFDRKAV
jgi:ATP-dependent RNA helicase DeaD